MAARGGAVPVILESLTRKDAERRAMAAELAALGDEPAVVPLEPRAPRRQLLALVDDWQGLAAGDVPETRELLAFALRGRISFRVDEETTPASYQLTVPIAFDRLLGAVLPPANSQRIPLGTPHSVETPFRQSSDRS